MKKKILVICSGVGHVQRGFESFSLELCEAFESDPEFSVILGYGGSTYQGSGLKLVAPSRDSSFSRLVARVIMRSPYFVEQAICATRSLPFLTKFDVILTSDGTISNMLWHFRKIFGFHYHIIFSNGAPFSLPYPKSDFVQHVNPLSYKEALEAGLLSENHMYLPYGFKKDHELPDQELKNNARISLGISPDDFCVLCVGAIGKNHKRLKYLIQEMAGIPKVKLFIIGQPEQGSKEIEDFGKKLLSDSVSFLCSLPKEKTTQYMLASDLFVLPSLQEGFGRVVVEAVFQGAPTAIHNSQMNRELFSEISSLIDMSKPGELRNFVLNFQNNPQLASKAFQLAQTRFSWSALYQDYKVMFSKVLNLPRTTTKAELIKCLGSHK